MWRDFWEAGGMVIVIIIGIATLVVGGMTTISYLQCYGLHRATGIEVRYDFGCYAKVDNRWVPSQYVFGTAHELRIKEETTK
jgi:hypothetical protein